MEPKDNTHAIEFEDKLDSFLKGGMAPAEEQEFMTLLSDNQELKKKAIVVARLAKAMRQVGEQRDTAVIEDITSATKEEVENVATRVTGDGAGRGRIQFRRFIISFSVAASILLCVFGGYKYYKYEQTTSLGQEYLAYFPASEFSRGEEDKVSKRIQFFYGNIADKKDMDATIEELFRMWDASRSEQYNDYTEYMPELGWMLANAYLCDNDKENALEVLDKLIEDCPEDTAIGEKARELKQKVEDL